VFGEGVEKGIGIVGTRDYLVAVRLQDGLDARDDDRMIVGNDHGARHGREGLARVEMPPSCRAARARYMEEKRNRASVLATPKLPRYDELSY
jgi:hypothetical protein